MAKTGPGGAKDSRIKNTLPRRMYKERGQLKRREHLGILEKKKDYQRRSKDFKQKKNIIRKYHPSIASGHAVLSNIAFTSSQKSLA